MAGALPLQGAVQTFTLLTVSDAMPVFGETLTLQAAIGHVIEGISFPPPTPITGTVTFTMGSTVLGTAAVNANAGAQITITASTPGSYTIQAAYSGDTNYAASSGSGTITVLVDQTAVSLPQIAPPNYVAGQTVMLGVTVSARPPGSGTPRGTVTFVDGAKVIGSALLDGLGNAAVSTSFLAGMHTIGASYSGDANFAASGSPVLTINVQNSYTITTLGANPTNPAVGQSVTFTASVTGTGSGGVGSPSGTVTFLDGINVLGSAALNGTSAVYSTSALTGGIHTVTASYSGDSNFGSSTSAPVVVTVGNVPTVTLVANPYPFVNNSPETLTMTVTGLAGLPAPTGTVTFKDGSNVLGTSTLSATGQATISVAFLAGTTHNVTATYSGDKVYTAATASISGQGGKGVSSTTLYFAETSSTFTLTAVVTGNGNVVPTGTVQFNDKTTGATLATVTLTNGSANVSLTMAQVTDTFQAAYSGDGNYQASTSQMLQPIVATSGLSFGTSAFAPDEISTVFGAGLAAAPVSASQLPLPTNLGGVKVSIVDASNASHAAQLFYVSPTQINFIVPSDTPTGTATLTVNGAAGASWSVSINIANSSPSLAPVGQITRAHADGSVDALVATANFNTSSASWVPVPISYPASSTDTLYLVLYGTGFRHAHSATTCAASGQAMTVQFSGAQQSLPGVDQTNVVVPTSLRGAGQVQVTCSVDGQASNPMSLLLQ